MCIILEQALNLLNIPFLIRMIEKNNQIQKKEKVYKHTVLRGKMANNQIYKLKEMNFLDAILFYQIVRILGQILVISSVRV